MSNETVSYGQNVTAGDIQTMSHIVNSCLLTKFDGGLRLHTASQCLLGDVAAKGRQCVVRGSNWPRKG